MIDLHVHTNCSDGTDSVEELLIKAEAKGMKLISITDHDSVEAYSFLENMDLRALFSGKILVGVEMKAYYNGIPLEVLGYGIDYKKIKLRSLNIYDMQVESLKELKDTARKLGFIFDENINVSKTDPSRKYASYTLATELLKYEENKKIFSSIGPEVDEHSFYRVHVSNKKSVFYYDESKLGVTLKDAIKIIHDAGGLAFLAHPLIYPYENKDKLKEIEKILRDFDLDGLECEYCSFDEEERESLKQIAIKCNKFISGGTDYHANQKPHIELGTGINNNIKIKYDLIENWIDRVETI